MPSSTSHQKSLTPGMQSSASPIPLQWVSSGTLLSRIQEEEELANTPSFVISTFSFSMVLMGWGGAAGLSGVAGIFFFVGPVLLILATIFEWIMGNFFPMMVCSLFAVFWLSFGLLQLPTLGLAAAYSATGNAAEGAASKEFNAVIGLYLIVWGFALFTFFIFTLKTNCVFAGIFGFVTIAAWVLSGAYFKVASGDYVMAGHLQLVSLPSSEYGDVED